MDSEYYYDDAIRAIVEREWQRLLLKKFSSKSAETNDDYSENLEKISKYTAALRANGLETGWHLSLPQTHYRKARITKCYRVPSHRVPEFYLKNVPRLPRMCMWAPIQRNVIVEDENFLHHIPYIADDVVNDEKWHDDLLEIYDYKVHVASEDGFTDDVLAELVDVLTGTVWDENNSGKGLRRRTAQPIRIDKECAFKYIADLYKFRVTPEEVKEKYEDYQLTKNKESIFRETIPNIDGNQTVVYSREKALNSFQTLFCRRCFLYDCIAHNFYAPLYKPDEEDYSYTGPCGKDCFLNIDNVCREMFITSSRRSSNYEASGDHPKVPFDSIKTKHWTFSERTLFNVVVRTFQCNFCAIARVLGNKTCAEVYVYYNSFKPEEKEAIQTLVGNDREQMIQNRKKKNFGKGKGTSIWSKHFQKFKENSATEEEKVQKLYKPCDHPGLACSADIGDKCLCFDSGTFCEKFCNCNPNCDNRFPGCNCKGACITKSCPCHNAARECDPDVCKTCGAAELDLLERRDKFKCTNVSMQRGFHKHLLLGPSEVSGWGVFLNGTANKDELISEYCGETISQEEADRRGKVYDRHKSSFLFNLNSEHVVDAKRKGNKIRFANHSVNANCKASVKMVNGDYRIGIFANRNIDKFEELFFDYRYGPNDRLNFVCIERPNVK